MNISKLKLILLFSWLSAFPTFAVASTRVTDSFDDGDISNGAPIDWYVTDPGDHGDIDGGFRLLAGGCCPGIQTNVDHQDIRLETTLRWFDAGYTGLNFREQRGRNYWAGVQRNGELFIGYSDGGVNEAARGVYLPTGRIDTQDLVSLELTAIGNEISLTAWDVEAGEDSAATVTWTDQVDRNPEGGMLGVHFNAYSQDPRRVDILEFSYTLLDVDFDCDGSGTVDIGDLMCTEPDQLDDVFESTDLIHGDADGDGRVAFEDFLLLSANFGSPGTYTEGDFDLSGSVDFSDFLILSANFGQSPSLAASVPEPTSFGSILIGSLLFGVVRGRIR